MVDHLSKEKRTWNMSRIRSKDTKPELVLRSMLHQEGYRFRLNGKVSKKIHPKGCLPGKPDIVLTRYRTAVLVHGCFWHRHKGCKGATTPKTKTEWWENKFSKNVARDKKNTCELRKLGWQVITIWECELKDPEKVLKKISAKIANTHPYVRYTQEPAELKIAAEKNV